MTQLFAEYFDDESVPPLDGAIELLEALLSRGVPFAVATQSRPAWTWAMLRSSGLERYFDVVVTAQEVAHPKPAPDIYLHTATAARCRAERTPRHRGFALWRCIGSRGGNVGGPVTTVELPGPPQPGVLAVISSLKEFDLRWLAAPP